MHENPITLYALAIRNPSRPCNAGLKRGTRTFLDVSSFHQRCIACGCSHEQSCRLKKSPPLGNWSYFLFTACNHGRIRALLTSKHPISHLELVCPAVNQECGGFHDDAGELGARYPWKWRLVLVFAADLEEVKEVCCRGMNAD